MEPRKHVVILGWVELHLPLSTVYLTYTTTGQASQA